MSNYATIMSFKEFKKILDSNLKNMVICYVRITSKDACEIFDERTDAPNRKSSITNIKFIRDAIDTGRWDNNAGGMIVFGKKLAKYNNKRQLLDGLHRIKALASTKNPNAYIDIAVKINAEPSSHQDCGKHRNAIDQVKVAGILGINDFSPKMEKALNIFFKQLKKDDMDVEVFYTKLLDNYKDELQKLDSLLDLRKQKRNNMLYKYVSSLASLINLYFLEDLNEQDLQVISNFFKNPENPIYNSKKFNSLRDLNRILKNTCGGGEKKALKVFDISTKAFLEYKQGLGKRVYDNSKKNNIQWPQLFDFTQESNLSQKAM